RRLASPRAPPPASEIYTLSLHDALPIFGRAGVAVQQALVKREERSVLQERVGAGNLVGAGFVRGGNLKCVGYKQSETRAVHTAQDRKSTRLNSSHVSISYAVFCLK